MSATKLVGKTFAVGLSSVAVILCLGALYFLMEFFTLGDTLALSKAILFLVFGAALIATVIGGGKLVERVESRMG